MKANKLDKTCIYAMWERVTWESNSSLLSVILAALLWRKNDLAGIGSVSLVLRLDTDGAESGIGAGTRVVCLLYCVFTTLLWNRHWGALSFLREIVVIGTRVHVGVSHTKILSNVCTDPVWGILLVHWDDVRLVLSWAWHIQVLSSLVNLHSECELGLLLARCISIVWVARIWEVEVAWDVVLRAWNSHELHLIPLLLLDGPYSGGKFSSIINSRALAALVCHAERSTTSDMSRADRVVESGANLCVLVCFFFLLHRLLALNRPFWSCVWISRLMSTRSWNAVVSVGAATLTTTEERFRSSNLLNLRVITACAWSLFCQVWILVNIPDLVWEGIASNLVRMLDLTQIRVDMVVLGGSWSVERLLALVWWSILPTASAPSWVLNAFRWPIFCLYGVLEFVITRPGSIHLLRLQVWLLT